MFPYYTELLSRWRLLLVTPIYGNLIGIVYGIVLPTLIITSHPLITIHHYRLPTSKLPFMNHLHITFIDHIFIPLDPIMIIIPSISHDYPMNILDGILLYIMSHILGPIVIIPVSENVMNIPHLPLLITIHHLLAGKY